MYLKITKQKKIQTALEEKLIILIESSFDKDYKKTVFCVVLLVHSKLARNILDTNAISIICCTFLFIKTHHSQGKHGIMNY